MNGNQQTNGSLTSGTPPPRASGRSSADEFLNEHRILQREVDRLRADNVQLTIQRDVYANTCAEHVEKIERLETALRRVTRYVTAMRTRMKVIKETITAADREASEFAYEEPKEEEPKPPVPPREDDITERERRTLERIVGGDRNQHLPEEQRGLPEPPLFGAPR